MQCYWAFILLKTDALAVTVIIDTEYYYNTEVRVGRTREVAIWRSIRSTRHSTTRRRSTVDVSNGRTRRVSQSNRHLVGQTSLHLALRCRLLDLSYR